MWSTKFRSLKLKHVYNPARSTGLGNTEAKRDRANEGGEVLLFRQHLQVHRFPIPAEEVPDLCADGHSAYDGFLPVVVHFQSYSVVLVMVYGHPTIGVRAASVQRLHRLG
eukprot:9312291-Pyramimonas_sp.AAC.1